MIRKIIYFAVCLAMAGCTSPSLPEVFSESKALPKIYPDYTNVTIPINMAPLTFELDEKADEMIARYAVGEEEIICAEKAQPAIDNWRKLAEKAKGGASPLMSMPVRQICGPTTSLFISISPPTVSIVT